MYNAVYSVKATVKNPRGIVEKTKVDRRYLNVQGRQRVPKGPRLAKGT